MTQAELITIVAITQSTGNLLNRHTASHSPSFRYANDELT